MFTEEPGRGHADNRDGRAVDAHDSTENGGIAPESPPPIRVVYNGDGVLARHTVIAAVKTRPIAARRPALRNTILTRATRSSARVCHSESQRPAV